MRIVIDVDDNAVLKDGCLLVYNEQKRNFELLSPSSVFAKQDKIIQQALVHMAELEDRIEEINKNTSSQIKTLAVAVKSTLN